MRLLKFIMLGAALSQVQARPQQNAAVLVGCGGSSDSESISLISSVKYFMENGLRLDLPPGCELSLKYLSETSASIPPEVLATNMHCLDTLPFLSSMVDNTCQAAITLMGHQHTSVMLHTAHEHGIEVVTSSYTSVAKVEVLQQLTAALQILHASPYTQLIPYFYQAGLGSNYFPKDFAGIFITAGRNQQLGKPKKAISYWSLPEAFETIIYSATPFSIIVIGAPDEHSLYPFTGYAPGMLAMPMVKRKIYTDEQPVGYGVEEKNQQFIDGAEGNSYIAPHLAGIASLVHAKIGLSGSITKAYIYFFSITHQQVDDASPKKGLNGGVRFLGHKQQKTLKKYLWQHGEEELRAFAFYAEFCYRKFTAAGFDNAVYDKWLTRCEKIGSGKLKTYYREASRTKDPQQGQAIYDRLIHNLFGEAHTEL
jgi:hypothetical protein